MAHNEMVGVGRCVGAAARLAYERLRSMCVMHGILVHEPTKKPQAWCRLRLYRHDHADCLS